MIEFAILTSVILLLQGTLTLVWMLYAWDDPQRMPELKSPSHFKPPTLSITALIPARHEQKVIGDTIRSVQAIKYPAHLKEIVVLCRLDDHETISAAKQAILQVGPGTNIRLLAFDSGPVNKPASLNYGLLHSSGEIITIFDAEDEPHPDIFQIINTTFLSSGSDVVQSGVQLMNFRSHWFSALNVIEYYLWFKSGLHFFSRVGQVAPLGGNTVFIKRSWLNRVGGWDETSLTEDADLGIRLSLAGAKVKVIYDETHVTREETPSSVSAFIRQRTRWDQGFLQIFFKADWMKLPLLRQQLTLLYILLAPVAQAGFILYLPIGLLLALTQKLPLTIAMFSYIPLFLFILHLTVAVVCLYKFCKSFGFKFPLWYPVFITAVYLPYQALLGIAALRALARFILKDGSWEKTFHSGGHRNYLPHPAYDQVQLA